MSLVNAICAGALLWVPIGYVLGVDRVLEQWNERSGDRTAVRLDVRVSEAVDGTPARLQIDVHPELGMRVEDLEGGGRWVVLHDELVASNRPDRPRWIPQLEMLVLRDRAALSVWLGLVGVDVQQNELGRCGLDDCFVIGGRSRTPQLWLDKETFEPRRFVSPRTGVSELAVYREFGRARFPREMRVFDGERRVADLSLFELRPAPPLSAEDFSASWTAAGLPLLQPPPPEQGRRTP